MQVRTGRRDGESGALPADKEGAGLEEERAPRKDRKFTVLFRKIISGRTFAAEFSPMKKVGAPLCKKRWGGRQYFFIKKIYV